MNLNKYTKAELISRINKYKNDRIEGKSIFIKFKCYISQIWELILTLKGLIVKLTFITFIIKFFTKYALLSKIWRILNSIILAIFGISLIDNFGFDFISNLIIEFKIISWNIIDYLSNTHFYIYLKELFSKKEEIQSNENKVTNQSRRYESEIKSKTNENSENIGSSNRNSKISEWLKPDEEIIK